MNNNDNFRHKDKSEIFLLIFIIICIIGLIGGVIGLIASSNDDTVEKYNNIVIERSI